MKKLDAHKVDRYLHGTFAEFFGRTTYDGIWVGKNSFDDPDMIRAVDFNVTLPVINIPPHSVVRIVFHK